MLTPKPAFPASIASSSDTSLIDSGSVTKQLSKKDSLANKIKLKKTTPKVSKSKDVDGSGKASPYPDTNSPQY